MGQMKVAKADDEDFKRTRAFLQACESIWDNRNQYSLRCKESTWKERDDDEDKLLIIKLQKELASEEGCEPEEVDDRILMYEFIKHKYEQADCYWSRVIIAADVLIDNVCDPTEGHLAFYPGFECFHVANEQ
jgi:hypothetical protein